MQGRKTVVRVSSACTALLVILIYATYSANHSTSRALAPDGSHHQTGVFYKRHLLDDNGGGVLIGEESRSCNNNGGSVDNANCSKPLHHNDSCQFVRDQCSDDVALFNYLLYVVCYLPSVKVHKMVIVVVVVYCCCLL